MFQDAVWVKANAGDSHIVTVRIDVEWPFQVDFRCGKFSPHNFFYGNQMAHPGEMLGLSQFYNTMDPQEAQCAVNVIDGSAVGRQRRTSIWLLVWGHDTVFLATPSGEALETKVATVIKDWRFVVRIANVWPKSTAETITHLVRLVFLTVPSVNRADTRPVLYMPSALKRHFFSTAFSTEVLGRGIPIREAPLRLNEDRVSASSSRRIGVMWEKRPAS